MEASVSEGGVPEQEREVKAEAGGGVEDMPKKRNVWEHPTGRMLTMAGLFDICKSEDVSYCMCSVVSLLIGAIIAGRSSFHLHCDNS